MHVAVFPMTKCLVHNTLAVFSQKMGLINSASAPLNQPTPKDIHSFFQKQPTFLSQFSASKNKTAVRKLIKVKISIDFLLLSNYSNCKPHKNKNIQKSVYKGKP